MKHFLLAVAIVILSGVSCYAQKFSYGLHAGVNVANFKAKDLYRVYDSKSKVGYQIGGDVNYTLNNGISFVSGLDAMVYGGKFSTQSQYASGGQNVTEFPEVNTKEVALEIPLKVGYKFSLSEKSYLMPTIGVYGRYSIASIKDDVVSLVDYTTNTTTKEKWNCFKDYSNPKSPNATMPAFNRFDFGFNVGVLAVVASHYSISASYSHGLINHSKKYELKNRNINISLGYLF